MPTVADLVRELDRLAPFDLAFSFDKVGLQVGDPSQEIDRVLVTLDRSRAAVARAAEIGAGAIVAHHPLLFSPLGSVLEGDHVGGTVRELVRRDIALIAYHTNWDVASGGINDALADRLEMTYRSRVGSGPDRTWRSLRVFVPTTHLDAVCEAVWAAVGEGPGPYSRTSFRTVGTGTFRPLPGASPFDGEIGADAQAEETEVEFFLRPSVAERARAAALTAHPYETAVLVLAEAAPLPLPAGRIGRWTPRDHRSTARFLAERLGHPVEYWPSARESVEWVAVVGGAASGDWRSALAAGADLFVTGEVKQDVAVEAQESGLAIAACGHYATEQPGMAALKNFLTERGWDAVLYEPEPGGIGRPF